MYFSKLCFVFVGGISNSVVKSGEEEAKVFSLFGRLGWSLCHDRYPTLDL